MTLTADEAPPEAAAQREGRRISRPEAVEHACVILALAWWAGPLTDRVGGRGPGAVSVGLALLLPALLVVQPWRRVGPWGLALGGATGGAALFVCVVSATGWYGGNDAASYCYAALLGLTLLGYARGPRRRELVTVVIMAAGMGEFLHAFPAWAAGDVPARVMIGSFYWWNPFAAFLLPGALLGLSSLVWARGAVQLLGAFAFPLCTAGIVLSTSRATMACLAAGVLAVAALALLRPRRLRALGLCLLGLALAGLVLTMVTGPPVFPHRQPALAGTAARSQGQSLSDNGGYRLEFWQEAWAVARRHPVAGGGFHSLAAAGQLETPAGWARSNLAHNGYLQALSDGGLLLAVPFLALLAMAASATARGALRLSPLARGGSALGPPWVAVGVPLAAGGLLAHTAVDFDWSHPANLAMTAALLGVGAGLLPGRRPRRAFTRGLAGAGLVGLLVTAGLTATAWDRVGASLAAAQRAPDREHRLALLADSSVSDVRVDQELLRAAFFAPGATPPAGDAASLRRALERTRRLATQDRHLALLRAGVQALLGDSNDALAEAASLRRAVGRYVPPYADELARVYAYSGRLDEVRHLQAPLIRQQTGPGDGWPRVLLLERLLGPSDEVTRCAAGFAMAASPAPVGRSIPLPLTGPPCDRLTGGAA